MGRISTKSMPTPPVKAPMSLLKKTRKQKKKANKDQPQPHPHPLFYSRLIRYTPSCKPTMRELHNLCQKILLEQVLPNYGNSVSLIRPYSNSVRPNNQTPQAFRMFFARDCSRSETPERLRAISKNDSATANGMCCRPAYGHLAVLRTTGYNPTDGSFVVRPFTPDMEKATQLLRELLKTEETTKTAANNKNEKHGTLPEKWNWNHMEVKIYSGQDQFLDPKTKEPFQINDCSDDNRNKNTAANKTHPIRVDANKNLGLHNDFRFHDDGTQDKADTADGKVPVATLSFGTQRTLTFVTMAKELKPKSKSKSTSSSRPKWNPLGKKHNVTFDLGSGSVFVLDPRDETPNARPDRGNNNLCYYKTKHKAKFKNDGLSVALVFRSVRERSLFESTTHQWRWENDPKFSKKVGASWNRCKHHWEGVTPFPKLISSRIEANMVETVLALGVGVDKKKKKGPGSTTATIPSS